MPYEEQEWLNKGLITEKQFSSIDDIRSRRVFSITKELQALLYVGILLLTAAASFIIYENIGSIGHLAAVVLIAAMAIGTLWYILSRSNGYSHEKVVDPNPYYSYITLLCALLWAGLFTYLQLQFEFLGDYWSWLTLLTAALFGYMAYRFDHIGVLSLAITSAASFLGLRIEPDIFNSSISIDGIYYYNTGVAFAVVLAGLGLYLNQRAIKKHFTGVFMQFAVLLGLFSILAATFEDGITSWYCLLAMIFSGLAIYYSFQVRSTWYMLYGVGAAYILVSALFVHFCWEVLDGGVILMMFYFGISPVVPLLLVLKTRNRFK